MIAILGTLIGFVSSSLPNFLKILQDKYDKQHELDLIDKQIELARMNIANNLNVVELNAEASELKSLYTTYKSGVPWVDSLNGTVRPVLSYCFFILYAIVKFMQFHALGADAPVSVHMDVLWSDTDNCIFSSIVAFYFGSRYFEKK